MFFFIDIHFIVEIGSVFWKDWAAGLFWGFFFGDFFFYGVCSF